MPRMGPCVLFAPVLLTLSLHITLHIHFISSWLFILLYVTCVMVNKAVKKSQGQTIIKQLLDEVEHDIKTEVCVICRSRRLRQITQTRGFDSS